MSIKGQGHSLTLVKGHSDFKVKCLTFGLYIQVSDSGPLGPLVLFVGGGGGGGGEKISIQSKKILYLLSIYYVLQTLKCPLE